MINDTPPEIAYETQGVTLWRGDCIEVMRGLPDESVHAVVTDPPYGLDFMGKVWDSPRMLGQLATGLEQRGAFAYGGTHSRRYAEHNGAAFERWVEVWATEALRVLKPGGHMIAFGGSRTWHRLAAGIEDAGFEIRDSIAWLYGSGFPKSLDVSKAIDKLDAGVERLARSHRFTAWMRSTGLTAPQLDEITGTNMGGHYLTSKSQPAVPTVALFELLRPHLGEVPEWVERLVVERDVESQNFNARGSTFVHSTPAQASVWREKYEGGVAAPATEAKDLPHTPEAAAWQGWGTALKPAFEPIVVARKPLAGTVAANVLQYGTGALNIDASRIGTGTGESRVVEYPDIRGGNYGQDAEAYAERGKVSRTVVDAGRWPANVVLDESQAEILDAQAPRAGAAAPASGPSRSGPSKSNSRAGVFNGTDEAPAFHGDAGGAARFFPTFRYEPKAPTSERPAEGELRHPTVKPLDLMRWLVRLVTPPGGVVLEPFAGSGTTLEAAVLEGFEVIGIERDADYLPLIRRRLAKPMQQSLFGDWEEGA